ncbi:MAG: aldo/keto reductase [bacterium]
MKFLKSFFEQVPRDKIFITVKLERCIEDEEDIEKQLDTYLEIMGLDYVDSLILHAPSFSKLPLQKTYEGMYKMIGKGKTRYLSGSNLSLDQLKSLYENGITLFSIEALYNLECKVNEDSGLMRYCQDNDILVACYQPLRRNRTASHNYHLLIELAKKYNKTQNQILINRIVKWKKFTPLIKAASEDHVKQNLAALEFTIDDEDMKELDAFRSKEFDSIADKIDRKETGKSFPIYKYANQFE